MRYELGPTFKHWRSVRGLTQEDLAYEAGITTGTYSRIETGIADPHWSTVVSVTRVLGVRINLEGGEDAS
jgi:DNA-binding XRE family transcriptional regulator